MARDAEGTGDRGVTPVVAKTLEIGLVLLFVGGLSTALYGGVVPEYRATAGDEVADRHLAGAATRVEAAVPPPVRVARVERHVPLPATVRGAAYRVVANGRELALVHPHPDVRATARLALPARVVALSGTWESGARNAVLVTASGGRVRIRLVNR